MGTRFGAMVGSTMSKFRRCGGGARHNGDGVRVGGRFEGGDGATTPAINTALKIGRRAKDDHMAETFKHDESPFVKGFSLA